MARRSLSEWLHWQESLYPRPIELRLDRVRAVVQRLGERRFAGPVFTVSGTNGKGSTVSLLDRFLQSGGRRTGVYTSPHLIAYNERIRVSGRAATDAELVAAFERVEAARGETPLTFFEFGTLAAFEVFATCGADVWVLEVGMGGRLDAVNVVDADFAIITTVSLDHQEYLGHTVEEIAAEKAGILRGGRPGFYGDWPVPDAVRRVAAERGAVLHCLGEQFDFTPSRPGWAWRGREVVLENLAWPPAATAAQLRNISVALAALEQYDPALVAGVDAVNAIVADARPPGRFHILRRDREWILDVAHNPQAAGTLRAQLHTLTPATDATVVIGILGDKNLDAFADQLGDIAHRWIACTVDDARARTGDDIARRLLEIGMKEVKSADSPEAALALAREETAPGGRIIVCGSFRLVGPALRWLGIY
jgi:dihydrofolate synthase/folylpolyglutamate synthase